MYRLYCILRMIIFLLHLVYCICLQIDRQVYWFLCKYILVIDLAEGKALCFMIDFYLCTVHLFIAEPVLIIKPKHNPNPELGMTGPEYIFEKHNLIAADKFVSLSKIKMRFIYNGVDYVAPLYKEWIASVVRQGWPLLCDITTCYTDLMALMKKMPDGKSINEGLWLMHRHLGAASAVAEHTNFICWGASSPAFNATISCIVA